MSFNVVVDKNTKIKLYNMKKGIYKKYLTYINEILFDDNIICFIGKIIKMHMSLFIQECELTKLLDEDIDVDKAYSYFYIFNIYEEFCGINHLGIVNYISNIFIRSQIPILYINTFNENIIFVSEKDLDDAIICIGSFIDNDKIKVIK